jgi:hypothetical protein
VATLKHPPKQKPRGQTAKAKSLDLVTQETLHLWRRHHLGYDQTKYVVERVRCQLALEPPRTRNRTVDRLDRNEVERLIQATYRRFVVRRDWNFARSGEPATTFLKFQRSESPAQHECTFTFAEPAVRRNDSRYRFLAWDDSLVWLR